MKKTVILTILICSILSHCLALAPLTDENLKLAIQYGITSKQENRTMPQFLTPWMIPERLLKNPYRQKESIVLYSPYLLASIHARDKVEESRMPEMNDIRRAVREYNGITLLGARLNAPVVLKEGEYSVKLVQGKTVVTPYAVNFLSWEMVDVPKKQKEETKYTPDDGKQLVVKNSGSSTAELQKIAVLDFQFYFDSSRFAADQAYTVIISDKYCGDRNFEVDPGSVR